MLSDKIKEAQKRLTATRGVGGKKVESDSQRCGLCQPVKVFYAYFSKVEQAIAPFISAEVLLDYPSRRNVSYLKKTLKHWELQRMNSPLHRLLLLQIPCRRWAHYT